MLKILLKTRLLALLDRFSGSGKGKKALDTRKITFLIILGIALLGITGYLLSLVLRPMYASIGKTENVWLYFALAGAAAFLVSFMMTSFYAQGAIFEAQDNEMLLSMPIPPSAILGSRIGALYVLNLFFSAVFLGAAGIVKLTSGGTATALGIVIYILCIFLLALISTTLSCLLGWGVSIVTRRMRRKALFQLLFSLAFLALFYVISFGDIMKNLKTIGENSEGLAGVFRGVLYPFHVLGVACAEGGIKEFLIFAAICIVPFALMWFIMSKSFVKIVTSKGGAKKIKYEAKALRGSSVTWSLAKKDLTRFFNSSSYMLNAGLGLIYTIGLGIYLLITVKTGTAAEAANAAATAAAAAETPKFLDRLMAMAGPGGLPMLFALMLALVAGFTYISGPSISAEGNNLWILKSMPLRAADVLKSKVAAHLTIALPVSLVGSLILAVAFPMDAVQIGILILLPLLSHCFCALIGVIGNLYLGKVNFPSLAKAVKSNSAQLVPMLSTVIVTGLPSVLFFTVLKNSGIAFTTILFITLGLLAACDIGMYIFLSSPAAQKRWDKVGNA